MLAHSHNPKHLKLYKTKVPLSIYKLDFPYQEQHIFDNPVKQKKRRADYRVNGVYTQTSDSAAAYEAQRLAHVKNNSQSGAVCDNGVIHKAARNISVKQQMKGAGSSAAGAVNARKRAENAEAGDKSGVFCAKPAQYEKRQKKQP